MQAQEGVLDMTTQARLSVTPDLPYHPGPVTSLADLSLDELRFLRSCDKRWFELSPAKASAIIGAARKLIVDLVNERDADLASIRLAENATGRREQTAG
jgi:hypothetical protein